MTKPTIEADLHQEIGNWLNRVLNLQIIPDMIASGVDHKQLEQWRVGRGRAVWVAPPEVSQLLKVYSQKRKDQRIKDNKSFCGCPMCEHHTSAYELNKDTGGEK